jgi:hypothetical protein
MLSNKLFLLKENNVCIVFKLDLESHNYYVFSLAVKLFFNIKYKVILKLEIEKICCDFDALKVTIEIVLLLIYIT